MKPTEYLNIKISCNPAFIDILVAELAMLNYNSMMELEAGLEAYILQSDFNENEIKELKERYAEANLSYEVEQVIERNWNEEWEKNYDPIEVEQTILVRATFHDPQPNFKYELLINPRMSFGTGHHSTTYLMLKHQLMIEHTGKKVLDAGCGTAILAVMAEKLGASEILAYDNNAWSTENAPENVSLNKCEKISIQEGTIDTIELSGHYDIILANINKNVLLEEMPSYVSRLNNNGKLVLSGFYTSDNHDIEAKAQECGLQIVQKNERDDWSSIIFHN